MKQLLHNLDRVAGFFYPLLLSGICVLLLFLNFTPDTYLSGWDTLHPEFNFSLSIERIVSGVFRPEQGLGAVAAHSHMSDLPRVIFLYLSSFIFSNNFLRFWYIGVNLLLGVLGVYFLLRKIVFSKLDARYAHPYSFLGALYYLFNLGTLQQFYVPFEMFTTQYAALPWLFFTICLYLKQPTRRNLKWFCIVTLLSTPMAFAATLWYAYFLILLVFLIPFIKTQKKVIATLVGLTLLINSFWLIPNLYFIASGDANYVPEARINKIFSEEAFTYNKSYGNIIDSVIFKNFLFDWTAYFGGNKFDYLLKDWRSHLSNPYILSIGYINFAVVLLGIFASFRYNQKFPKSFTYVGILALIFIINLNPPFELFFGFLRDHFSLFKESLRFPFTKFSIILIFACSILFSIGQSYLFTILQKLPKFKFDIKPYQVTIQTLVSTSLLIIFMLPYFYGQLISPLMQVQIPQDYFDMFEWFNNQPQDQRVAILPINSFWGWIYYNWGFQGAQFISFGIKQPILDRDYDRWTKGNEDYYHQMSYAIYSQNPDLVKQVISKYKIHYLILDQNIADPEPDGNSKLLFNDEIQSLLSGMKDVIHPVKSFHNIAVYEVDPDFAKTETIQALNTYQAVTGPTGTSDIDWAYLNNKDYISGNNLPQQITQTTYPFLNLADNQNIVNSNLLTKQRDELDLSPNFINGTQNLSLEDYLDNETSIPAEVYAKEDGQNTLFKIVIKTPFRDLNNPAVLNYQIPGNLLSSKNNWVLNLDQNQTLILKSNNVSNYTLQGNIFLRSQLITNLTFHQIPSGQPIDNTVFNAPAELCSQPASDQLTSIANLDEGFTLTAKNAQTCLKIPLSKIINPNQISGYNTLMNLNFEVTSKTNSVGHYCLFDISLQRCLQENKYISPQSYVSEYTPISDSDIKRLELIFYLDGVNNQKLEEVTYHNFSTALTTPSQSISISPADLKNLLNDQFITISNKNKLAINYTTANLVDQVNIFEQGHISNSCSTVLPKQFDRRVSGQGYIEYSSVEGSSCDFFSFPNLVHNVGYLVEIESQNITGLPLRICAANNYTKRCDLYLTLPANKTMAKQLLLIPPTNDGGAGYNLHIDNYSVGTIPSVNRISTLQVVPFPYQWISNMHFTQNNNQQNSNVQITGIQEKFPFWYQVSYNNNADGYGILEFNQSYDSGWAMLGKTHVKVDDWANGWVIPPHSQGTSYIIFWPELLELGGLISLLGLFAYLFTWDLRKITKTIPIAQKIAVSTLLYLVT